MKCYTPNWEVDTQKKADTKTGGHTDRCYLQHRVSQRGKRHPGRRSGSEPATLQPEQRDSCFSFVLLNENTIFYSNQQTVLENKHWQVMTSYVMMPIRPVCLHIAPVVSNSCTMCGPDVSPGSFWFWCRTYKLLSLLIRFVTSSSSSVILHHFFLASRWGVHILFRHASYL